MKNSMLNKLKSGYEEMEAKPSADLWETLDHKLDAMPEKTTEGSLHRWKYAAVVLLMISFGTILYLNYPNPSGSKKAGYVMKKESEKMINPEFSEPVISDEVINQEKKIKTIAGMPESHAETTIGSKTIQPEISPVTLQHLAVQPHHISPVAPVRIENTISSVPEVVVTAERKTTYISANELLLGRKFDKTSKQQNTDAVKFGVFNFDKPKVENVTVLGVTVYTDTK